MERINIEGIAKCITTECIEENIEPYIISLALSFGRIANETFDTPTLIISIATKEEILEMKKNNNFQEIIWNQAEYDNQEIAYECIDKYFGRNCESMKEYFSVEQTYEFYLTLLLDLKKYFLNYLHKNTSYRPLVYVQELTSDVNTIIKMNFTMEEIEELKEKKLL